MPHTRINLIGRIAAVASSFALLGSAGAPGMPPDTAQLAWRAPGPSLKLASSETLTDTITYQMSSILRAMAAGRADPVIIIEQRSRTIGNSSAGNEISVSEEFVRRYGGDHPKDTNAKRRVRQQTIPFDQSGRTSILETLCKGEPALDDTPTQPGVFKKCPAGEPNDSHRYQDPGDAALAQFPAQPVKVGESWTFSRPTLVGRDLASGVVTYVDRLARIEARGSHKIAIIEVAGSGRIDVASDLQSRGFHTAPMTFTGTAEFDLVDGVPGMQHYTGHVEWNSRIMGAHIGLTLDEVYEAKPWTIGTQR